jgi:hypothetical protein
MKYVVEVAHLVNGGPVSLRRLSARYERVGAWTAVAAIGGVYLATMFLVALLARGMGRAFYAPELVGLWLGTALLVSVIAFRRVSRRFGRYTLGAHLDADAFAPFDVDLVRRVGDRFELTVVRGMRGQVESGRAPLPIEALAGDEPRMMTLDGGATAEVQVGTSTFVVRSRPIEGAADVEISRALFRLFSRGAIGGLQLALVASLFVAIPAGQTIDDRITRPLGPRAGTPWEAEKWLRVEAQIQARSLHQCFDPLPMSCQHSGYVGVGVSLGRDGDIRSNWIARSTFGSDCPVDQCMKDVVSTWVFDPLPAAMRVVLPVQVLRTDKPLPPKVAEEKRAEEKLAEDKLAERKVAEARAGADADPPGDWWRDR